MNTTFRTTAAILAVTSTLCGALPTQAVWAANGPTLSASADQIRRHISLDYLTLTPAQIAKRDQQLKPLYDYYREATAQKVVEQIKNTWSSNVYIYEPTSVYNASSQRFYTPSLKDSVSVMDSAVRYYTGFDLTGPFASLDPSILGQSDAVYLSDGDVGYTLSEGDSHLSKEMDFDYPFLLSIVKYFNNEFGTGPFGTTRHMYGVYSSLQDNLFDVPVLDRFLSAMKETNLKGLDATIVFTSGSGISYNGDAETSTTHVVYPAFSQLAPIPQPIIFISKDATESDITKTIKSDAPKIYAYNQLFDKNLLPKANDIAQELSKYPEMISALRRADSRVSEDNMRARLYEGFLSVSYGMMMIGLAPVTLPELLANPTTYAALTSVVVVQ